MKLRKLLRNLSALRYGRKSAKINLSREGQIIASNVATLLAQKALKRSSSLLESGSNMFGKPTRKVGDIIEPLLDEERFADREMLARINERAEVKGSSAESSVPPAPEAISSISSGLSIAGKIFGQGKLGIFGQVQGEVRASIVEIGEGAQVEGDIVAEELTIGGRVKGAIRANRVKLTSTAVVEGDIYHRSLAIEDNAQFEGMARRQENVIDTPSLVPANRSPAIEVNAQGNGAADGVDPSQTQAAPIDRKGRGKTTSNVPVP